MSKSSPVVASGTGVRCRALRGSRTAFDRPMPPGMSDEVKHTPRHGNESAMTPQSPERQMKFTRYLLSLANFTVNNPFHF